MAKLTNTNTTATAETATTATTATAPKSTPKSTPKKTNTTKAPKTDRKKTDTKKADTPKKTPAKTNNAPAKMDTAHDTTILAEIVADCTALAKYSKTKHFTDKYKVSINIPDTVGEKSAQYIAKRLKKQFEIDAEHLYTPLAYLTLSDGDDYILMSHKAPKDDTAKVTLFDVTEWLINCYSRIDVPADKSDSGKTEKHKISMTFVTAE